MSLSFSENTLISTSQPMSQPTIPPSMTSSLPIIISFDGNIGSGKSTKVKDIEKYYQEQGRTDILFIQEPVDEWNSIVDEKGVTILSNYLGIVQKVKFYLGLLFFFYSFSFKYFV